MDAKILLSKRETAALLGISVRTLEKLIAEKQIMARRIGRRVLLHRVAIERFATGR